MTPSPSALPDFRIAVVGGGLSGCLAALLLSNLTRARRITVTVLEYRPAPASTASTSPSTASPRGRSINLALSTRGLSALAAAGLEQQVIAAGVKMHGRYVHDGRGSGGTGVVQPYGKPGQCLYSVSRELLGETLVQACEALENVSVVFSAKVVGVDLDAGVVRYVMVDGAGGEEGEEMLLTADLIIGADGTYSRVRAAMERAVPRFDVSREHIPTAYKELSISEGAAKAAEMPREYLHVWPRGEFMLIALPNVDGSFTATLFMDAVRLEGLEKGGQAVVAEFFGREFPDAVALMPDVAKQFLASPTPPLLTVRCRPYAYAGRAVLIGDAAHAIVPFYGQGCNAAFEDCVQLRSAIWQHSLNDLAAALDAYATVRKPNADAIADLAMEHYHDMASKSASPVFALRRRLEILAHRIAPNAFMPLYSMVTFSNIPYANAVMRAAAQDRALTRITTAIGVAAVAGSIAVVASVVARQQVRQQA